MTRYLLFLLFFVLLVADMLGFNMSLAPGLSVKNGFLYLIFTGIAVETAIKRNRRIELLPVIAPNTLLFVYASFTMVVILLLIDSYRYEAVRSTINLKVNLADNLLVLLVFFYGVLTTRDALSLMKMMLWTMILVNVVTVADALNFPDLGLIHAREDGRIGGPVGESNQYAAFLAMFLAPMLGLVLTEHGVWRLLAAFGLAASVLAFLMTVSRGGVVGVVAGTVLGVIFLRKFMSTKHVVFGAAAILILAPVIGTALYLAGFGDVFYDRFIATTTSSDSFKISSGRSFIWSTALGKMFETPLSLIVGFGWDSYRYFPFRIAPHNSYLKIFFELGIIGLTLMLFAMANILRIARKALDSADADARGTLIAFIFGFLSVSVAVFFVDLLTPWLFVWAYTGAALRVAVSLQNDDHAAEVTTKSLSSTRTSRMHRRSR